MWIYCSFTYRCFCVSRKYTQTLTQCTYTHTYTLTRCNTHKHTLHISNPFQVTGNLRNLTFLCKSMCNLIVSEIEIHPISTSCLLKQKNAVISLKRIITQSQILPFHLNTWAAIPFLILLFQNYGNFILGYKGEISYFYKFIFSLWGHKSGTQKKLFMEEFEYCKSIYTMAFILSRLSRDNPVRQLMILE